MTEGGATLLRLTLARACAWALLIAGWIGIGSLALRFAPTLASGFALVALWLLALGAAASVATRGTLSTTARAVALCVAALITALALLWTVQGGGLVGLVCALLGWASLTALASGVVRTLRLALAARPAPPIAAATLGALCGGLMLGDLADHATLAMRLAIFVVATSLLLLFLQSAVAQIARGAGCRAGLFDCSLPAWPTGAWRDWRQWPTLLAGLAMLPLMAALPLMAELCRAQGVPPAAMVLVHLTAMFGPALLLRRSIAAWSSRTLASVCAALLTAGAGFALWGAEPLALFGLAVTQGAAWGLAWAGQLWAPARRSQQGTSPLWAAAGYAALTIAVGVIVEWIGTRGIADVHAALGLVAAAAWLVGALLAAHARRHAPPA